MASMVVIFLITKIVFIRYKILPLLLFTVTPIWVSLTNYFKYDISMMFFQVTTLFAALLYIKKPTQKVFFLVSFFAGLTVAVKVAAMPLLPAVIFTFFLFTPSWKKRNKNLGAWFDNFSINSTSFGIS